MGDEQNRRANRSSTFDALRHPSQTRNGSGFPGRRHRPRSTARRNSRTSSYRALSARESQGSFVDLRGQAKGGCQVRYPIDEKKLQRVREILDRHNLDALVARAPDNILYLTDYWTMKGYDLVIFPREGDPTLLVIEPQFREAQRTAWNKDVRFFHFYDAKDPRPPMVRSVEMAVEVQIGRAHV